jgi:hypothetical protein
MWGWVITHYLDTTLWYFLWLSTINILLVTLKT